MRGAPRRLRRRADREHGAVAVETALVAVLLCTLLFGIIECSLLMKDWLAVSASARAGARMAASEPRSDGFAQDAANQVGQQRLRPRHDRASRSCGSTRRTLRGTPAVPVLRRAARPPASTSPGATGSSSREATPTRRRARTPAPVTRRTTASVSTSRSRTVRSPVGCSATRPSPSRRSMRVEPLTTRGACKP